MFGLGIMENAEEKLIGKQVRNDGLLILGIITEIEQVVEAYSTYTVAVLDSGIRIKTVFLEGVK